MESELNLLSKNYDLTRKLTFKCSCVVNVHKYMFGRVLYDYLYVGQHDVYNRNMSDKRSSDSITCNGNWNVNTSLDWFFIVPLSHIYSTTEIIYSKSKSCGRDNDNILGSLLSNQGVKQPSTI